MTTRYVPGAGRNAAADFHGERRTNDTHEATDDGRPGDSALDGCTKRHAGNRASQRLRRRIEDIFGRGKDGRPMRNRYDCRQRPSADT